jgi:hypothetical protein
MHAHTHATPKTNGHPLPKFKVQSSGLDQTTVAAVAAAAVQIFSTQQQQQQ